MPAASTLRGKTHQAVAKFSGELVHFVRVTERRIQIHFTVLFWGWVGGGSIKPYSENSKKRIQ